MRKTSLWTCSSCIRAQNERALFLRERSLCLRSFSIVPPVLQQEGVIRKDESKKDAQIGDKEEEEEEEEEGGAMSRRLAEMAEETMDTGSRSDRKLMQDVGFSEELKKQLEERIAQSTFNSENQQALSEANLPSSAGKGTRDQAAAQPWTGNESLQDSTLRMLDDSHKRLPPAPTRPPRVRSGISLKPAPKTVVPVGQRLANARDKTSIYALSLQSALTEEEREKMRKELKERFTPGARPMPATLQGLASLANERIEDAIARGQFKNIPRGKGKNVERDYNANSPFLDTTEYFMNKIIQKQEIVPPWIEKQQELVKMVNSFRGRLRNDWRRHAARTISSKGGSVEYQIRRAQAYALAEEKLNPKQPNIESLSQIDGAGNLATLTVTEKSSGSSTAADTQTPPETTITVTETSAADTPPSQPPPSKPPPTTTAPPPVLPMAYPLRDPAWESAERAYHTLAIAELNSLTRSYNLMAPKLAQKPYYALPRELARCYADIAPQLADTIAQRARTPEVRIEIGRGGKSGLESGGVLADFGGHVAKTVREEDYKTKGYGFRQFWRDLFRGAEGVKT